jgi:hypothetical protein
MGRNPASNNGRSRFLSRHESNIRRIDSAISQLRKTAQASRQAVRASRKSSR